MESLINNEYDYCLAIADIVDKLVFDMIGVNIDTDKVATKMKEVIPIIIASGNIKNYSMSDLVQIINSISKNYTRFEYKRIVDSMSDELALISAHILIDLYE